MTQAKSATGQLHGRFAPDLAGERLDRGLASLMPQISRSRAKLLIESGAVTLDGRRSTIPSAKVSGGEKVTVLWQESDPTEGLVALPMELAIVYEDADLLVLDKPAGLVVHPGPGHSQDSLVNGLIAHCGAEFLQQLGNRGWSDPSDWPEEEESDSHLTEPVLRPGIVHRLDKDTSGLLVVAKNDRAYRHLAEQFAAHSIDRAYHALVWGIPEPREATISNQIGRSPKDRKIRTVLREGGQSAITHYRHICHWSADSGLADSSAAISLIEARLQTGRTHQIRVHMTHLGHPVVGDPVYGRPSHLRTAVKNSPPLARAVETMRRQALHAVELGFEHPTRGDRLNFKSAPPPDFQELVHRLTRELPRNREWVEE
ncbi:MAG: RluA family pseudouridine synthase [Alphaproteobacteria bacterium]|nr:RluA family pseudouridine synthase [Alphaproteobacteria bacterium]